MRIPRAALVLLAAGLLAIATRPRRPRSQARRIVRISRVVADLDRSEAFYRDALGFETLSRGTSDAMMLAALGAADPRAHEVVMRLGSATIALVCFAVPGRPYPPHSRSDDLWFQHLAIVVRDMDAAYAHLAGAPLAGASGWQAISDGGPQQLPPSNGAVRAFKFRDPDGHPLELIWFPPNGHGQYGADGSADRGTDGDNGHAAPPPAPLCLGVDHSALAISATPRSLRCYRALGFRISDRSLNRGPAQDRLDGLSQARVRVTGLRPALANGPGLELLGYHPPGRPAGTMALNDQATDWVTIEVATLFGDRYRAMRDPDGHRLLLVAQGSGVPV